MSGSGKIPSWAWELWSRLLLYLISIDVSVCLHLSSFNSYLSACQEPNIFLGIRDTLVNSTKKEPAFIELSFLWRHRKVNK